MRRINVFVFIFLMLHGAPGGAKEARYYQKLQAGEINCLLCPRGCILREGQTGFCRTRINVKGELESLVYGRLVSLNVDPIEKKPLFHFLPNTQTLSLATAGCNVSPEQLIAEAKESKCPSISYTYSEPTAFYDYMYDSSMLARKNGIKNVLVSCGYINPGPLKNVAQFLDAANVDLKGFSDNTYKWVAAARLAPVLETLKGLKAGGVWLEVGYLVIPSVNDSTKELKDMVNWVSVNLGKDVPLHFLRFFPQHKLTNLPPTPVAKLEEAYRLAKEAGINYVYLGNVPGSKYENTYCPKCGKMIVGRKGYFIESFNIVGGHCRFCNNKIPGVWK
jgi:pyruvate formate lyase activating enzyme